MEELRNNKLFVKEIVKKFDVNCFPSIGINA